MFFLNHNVTSKKKYENSHNTTNKNYEGRVTIRIRKE